MKSIIKVMVTTMFLLLLLPTISQAVNVNEGSTPVKNPNSSNTGGSSTTTNTGTSKGVTYTFTDKDTLTDSGGKVHKSLFPDIVKSKQSNVITEMDRILNDKFKTPVITGDLEIVEGGSLWEMNLQDLKLKATTTTFIVRNGGKEYKITIPPGAGNKNVAVINNAIAGIEKYMEATKEGVLYGSLKGSFNIFTMYPNNQVPLIDILEDKKVEGKPTQKVIKTSGVTMTYGLDSFINPLFGKMPYEDVVIKDKKPQKIWEDKIKDVKLSLTTEVNKLEFEVESAFEAFLSEYEAGGSLYSPISTSTITKTDGLTVYKTKYTSKDVSPKSLLDGTMQLILPTVFESEKDRAGRYKLSSDSGYRPEEGVKLHITNFHVYLQNGEILEKKAAFGSYDIDLKSLVITSITIGEDGKYAKDGRKVGAVVPLWFKEAIADTRQSDVGKGDLLITGRRLKLDNNYSGKITLDDLNRDLFGVDSKGNGKNGIELRRFAFDIDKPYTDAENHTNLPTTPERFQLQSTFIPGSDSDSESDLKGFYMVRNNWYLQSDSDLTDWLNTEEAKSLTHVKATELRDLITGAFENENQELSFEEWNRLQEIRAELDTTWQGFLKVAINVICMVFGVLLIFYSILLMMAYWLDMFNVLMDFSVLNFMTNKRLYPIYSSEDTSYLNGGEDVKYVTFWNMLLIMLIGIAFGVAFIYATPIIKMLVYIYFNIIEWVGVV